MTNFRYIHLQRCTKKSASISFISILGIVSVIIVIVHMCVLPTVEIVDKCNENICVFADPHFPRDISCRDDVSCMAWSHPCDAHKCTNTSRCIYAGLNDYECICYDDGDNDLKGRFCNKPKLQATNDSCDDAWCLNGGTCHGNYKNFQCICPSMWRGKHCQLPWVTDVADLSCKLPVSNLAALKDTTIWYEVSRSPLPHREIDACTTYNFTVDETNSEVTVKAVIRSLPLNRFSKQRYGWMSQTVELHQTNSTAIAVKQPFLPTATNERDNVHQPIVSIYNMRIPNGDQEDKRGYEDFLVLHMCQVSEIFGHKESVSILSKDEPPPHESIEHITKAFPSLGMTGVHQGHSFCSMT
jgi:hypothetical protein